MESLKILDGFWKKNVSLTESVYNISASQAWFKG